MTSHRLHVPQQRSTRKRTGILVAGALGTVLAGVTACSAVAAQTEPVAATSAIPAAAAPGQTQALSGPNLATNDTSIGKVATSDGFTLYEFTKDSKSPSRSTCTGTCEQQWPPVLATDTPWLKGVPSDKVGEVTRPDGKKQLTLGGWPLYRYAKDTAPGDTKGNGVGGTWCAIGPDGKPTTMSEGSTPAAPAAPAAAAPAAQAPAASSSSGSGGYSAPASGGASGGDSGGYGAGGY